MMVAMDDEQTFPIRRYTRKQLATLYGCSTRSITRWVNHLKIGKRIGHFYTAEQVRQIVDKLGTP